MTAEDLYKIIGIKEAEIYDLTQRFNALLRDLEAARAHLPKEQACDGNDPV
jgi:hypothetical protein